MKLLFCRECKDVVTLLVNRERACRCGKSSGAYEDDGHHAHVSGPCEVIGIDNATMVSALSTLAQAPNVSQHALVHGLNLRAWLFRHDYDRIARRVPMGTGA